MTSLVIHKLRALQINASFYYHPRLSHTKASSSSSAVMTNTSGHESLPNPTDSSSTTDTATLLARISDLEAQLRSTTSQLQAALAQPISSTPESPPSRARNKKPPKPFNPSRFSTRFIALKFAYLGASYNGYEHANGTVTPKPTVEEVLWKALRKTRLISPEVGPGCDAGVGVVWEREDRERVYGLGSFSTGDGGNANAKGTNRGLKLDVNWEGCEYSKSGRTDRGVSAFGQVVGIKVRSNRPLPEELGREQAVNGVRTPADANGQDHDVIGNEDAVIPALPFGDNPDSSASEPPFDDIAHELPFISILNSVLPSTIRILAWCPHPPEGFNARFSCRERRYKYFFTNPAFLPTPGPLGMTSADGRQSQLREGWLNIDRMGEAAANLVGTHDYRNLSKIDASKQMTSCVRTVRYAGIEEWRAGSNELTRDEHLNADGKAGMASLARRLGIGAFVDEGPKVYSFTVHGSAFLWHQVRCMVGVLFLVGQGLEEPSVINELLDVEKNPRKPHYGMADDAPLVLWDCVFSEDGEDALDWIYSGDEKSIPSLTTKHDGKFGLGGIADTLWSQWRRAKIDEVLTASLLDLSLTHGDGSASVRGGFRDPATASRSQKIFDGGDGARVAGTYVPVMQKPRVRSLEEQNATFLAGRQARRDARAAADVEDDQ